VSVLAAAGMLTAAWVGLALIGALGGLPRRAGPHRWALSAVLAAPVGTAVTSATAFLWLVALRPVVTWPAYVTCEMALAGALAAFWLLRRPGQPLPVTEPTIPPHRAARLLAGLGGVSVAALLAHLVRAWLIATFRSPLGDWDAWAIWNLRARFLFSADAWRNGFSTEIAWSHPDYPLLLPSSVARGYCWSGETGWASPAVIALLFLLAIPALSALVLVRCKGLLAAQVAAVLSLGVAYWSLDYSQYADMPLAFLFLAVNALFLLARWHPGSDWMWPVAGLLAGAMVWTKNEGWVMLAAVVASELVVRRWTPPDSRRTTRQVIGFGLGLLPLLAVTVGFKLTLAPHNDLLSGLSLAQLWDPDRYLLIARHLARMVGTSGPFRLPILPILAGYLLVSGAGVPLRLRPAVTALGLRLALVAVALTGVFLLTPLPLPWHLENAADRLLMQLLPSLILLVVAAARPPFDADHPQQADPVSPEPVRADTAAH
jgi:hypothetical protein